MSGRLIDGEKLKKFLWEKSEDHRNTPEMSYGSSPCDLAMANAYQSVIDEIVSGRLDAQSPTPGQDGLTIPDNIMMIIGYLKARSVVESEVYQGNIETLFSWAKEIKARPTSQWIPDWRPIETADTLPKDGNYFLVIDMLNHGKPLVVFWHGSDFIECENGSSIEIESYTHWSPVAPLPPPPTREEV